MAWAGIEQRGGRGRTIHPTDMLAFAFLAWALAIGSQVPAGNEILAVILTIAWMSSAVTRLAELRRGERPAVRLQGLNLRTAAFLFFGTGPWLLLGFLRSAYPAWAMWKPIDMPPSLSALGISLAIAVIAEPFINARRPAGDAHAARADDHTGNHYRFSAGVAIRSGAIPLLSGNPVFVLLSALWLGVTLWRPPTVSGRSPLPNLPLASPSS